MGSGVMRRWRRWLLVVLCLFAGAFLARSLLFALYPFPYRQTIVDVARANGVSPYLVAAVIRAESRFRPNVVSDKGAVGLMQLLPDTSAWAAERMGMTHFTPADLTKPETNIAIGTWYLAELQREFGGNLVAALAAYNGGRKNVHDWLNSGRWDGKADDLEGIPFGETRAFVKRVSANYHVYYWLYGH